jgi:RNA polymerase sigma-70 factor (ECF subfamily)
MTGVLDIMQARDDRQDQFIRLFTANGPAIRGFVRSLVPTRDDADEVMQDVAVVLWRKFSGVDNEDFRRWAFGVARLQVLAWKRDKARDRHVFNNDVIDLIADMSSDVSDAMEEQRIALETCLQRLPERRRALVIKAYEPGVRIKDLATRIGRTPMSVYKELQRIRAALVDCTRRLLAEGKIA